MNQINNFHNSEFQQNLDEALDRLESLLTQKLSHKSNISQYKATVELLTEEKNKLDQQLINKTNECNNWKETCHEVINHLNSTIENIQAILKKE
ncbi:DUF4164 domain-containing protein [Ehrlichia japonica]|uniref:Uncharacterized protein n=1 Tax=Ehrlichia japonica TaxID=391036 RepID=X5H0C8_9RICK|nr:DUF4164 domain-containing protein [Ehrlichia japonica]AHX04289.1 hypothetical protein EHF_0347 [Ehrlichia japonica]